MSEPLSDAAVTKIVDRVPKAGMEAKLEQAIHALTQAAARFPGHLGVTVIRPALPAQPGFRLVYKFASSDDLRAWENSKEQHRLVSIANLYTQGEPHYQTLTGLEAWFTPATSTAPYPSRAKMTIVSWLGIFPLVYVYGYIVNRLVPDGTPVVVRVLAVTALVVPTMSYIVGPRLTRLFKAWLHSK
jgi:antibiotic biosynthesis monooxygenase (ABM) superfamily enzyme